MKNRGDIVSLLITGRSYISEIFVVGIIIALGVNLLTSSIETFLNLSPRFNFIVGIGIIVVGVIYLLIRLFSKREQLREYEAIFIYSIKENSLIDIPRYEFAESLVHNFQGASIENQAIKTIWEKEPLHIIRESVWAKEGKDKKHPRSSELVVEAVEYYILDKLSTHLIDYFSEDTFRETNIQEYSRGDIPQILLSNRFLDLFSKPMLERPMFVQQALDEPENDSILVWNEDGTQYNRIDLILPKGSNITRPNSSIIEINTPRMVISVETIFNGFSANLPRGFATFYLGITEFEDSTFFDDFMSWEVNVNISVLFKFGSLLSARGWEYYHWVDSFLNDLETNFSAEYFFSKINWENVHTTIMAQRNAFKISK